MAIDWAAFIKNRTEIPVSELEKFAGQWIAWSPDGTHVVAGSSESEEALIEQLAKAGRNPQDYVFGFLPGLDEGTL